MNSVDHPAHYNSHPSGIEAIVVCEHMPFCVGNATKYLWRAGLKTPDPTEDLQKAAWYIQREIDRDGLPGGVPFRRSLPLGVDRVIICESMSYHVGRACEHLWNVSFGLAESPRGELSEALLHVEREIDRVSRQATRAPTPAPAEQLPERVPAFPGHVTAGGLTRVPVDVLREIGLQDGGGIAFVQDKHGHYYMLSDKQFLNLIEPAIPEVPTFTIEDLRRLQERCAQEADYEVASGRINRFDAYSAITTAKHIREFDVAAWLAAGRPDLEMPR